MKRSIIIFLVVLILSGIGLLAWLIAPRPVPRISGTITLPDGSWVHLEAVTYGTNHLVGPPLAYVADRMPPSVRSLMLKYIGRRAFMRFSHTTSSPALVLWLNRDISARQFPTNLGYFECVLSDTNGTTCGDFVHYAARYPLEAKEFALFPRRQSEITLTIYYHDATNAVFNRGSLVFPNPARRRYASWKPEALPATKRAGDVAVTLQKVFTGIDRRVEFENSPHGHRLTFTTNTSPGTSKTICGLRLRPANTNEIWRAIGVVVSDVTGNSIAPATFDTDNESGDIVFEPGLWPEEPAWKLNFEITRAAGFSPGELFTFHDVPLGGLNMTNRIGWTTNCNGAQVTLEQSGRRDSPPKSTGAPLSSEFELRLGVTGLTNGLHLDLISAITDAGTELVRHWQSDLETNQVHRFNPPPAGAKFASFTFAVQRSRWVEFLAKPERKTARSEIAP